MTKTILKTKRAHKRRIRKCVALGVLAICMVLTIGLTGGVETGTSELTLTGYALTCFPLLLVQLACLWVVDVIEQVERNQ